MRAFRQWLLNGRRQLRRLRKPVQRHRWGGNLPESIIWMIIGWMDSASVVAAMQLCQLWFRTTTLRGRPCERIWRILFTAQWPFASMPLRQLPWRQRFATRVRTQQKWCAGTARGQSIDMGLSGVMSTVAADPILGCERLVISVDQNNSAYLLAEAPFQASPRSLLLPYPIVSTAAALCGNLLLLADRAHRRISMVGMMDAHLGTDSISCVDLHTLEYPEPVSAIAVCDYRSLFVGSGASTAEYDLETARPIWSCPSGAYVMSVSDSIVATARGGSVFLIDRRTAQKAIPCSFHISPRTDSN